MEATAREFFPVIIVKTVVENISSLLSQETIYVHVT